MERVLYHCLFIYFKYSFTNGLAFEILSDMDNTLSLWPFKDVNLK